jgi:uncharacterized membrane protein YkvA (DUF1232 family)
MSPLWARLVGLVAAAVVVWLLLVVALVRLSPGEVRVRELFRLLPDLLRLIARLARDRTLPRRVRLVLWLLMAYLASPIDLVPDFVPVVGYADDVVLVALALRSVVRRAGPEALDRHWPGTPGGLAAVRRLIGTP